jgi:hypothetical protein
LNDDAANICQGTPLLSVKRLSPEFYGRIKEENIQIVVRAPQHGAYRNIPQPSDRALNVPSGPVHIGAAAPPQLITLNCWVLSDDPARVFSVTIALGESVSGLKKAIKEEKRPDFDSIPADRLDLWKASVRVVEMFLLFIKLTGVHSSKRP